MAKKNEPIEPKRKLFRVIFRGREYLGTAEQFHAKVVAVDFATALKRACDAMELDPERIDAAAITLISAETELADGKVFDFARRSRGFGERGGWVCWDLRPRKESTGRRETEII
jgi:ATP phosphoribosyltransferase regulatory subunit HisZ